MNFRNYHTIYTVLKKNSFNAIIPYLISTLKMDVESKMHLTPLELLTQPHTTRSIYRQISDSRWLIVYSSSLRGRSSSSSSSSAWNKHICKDRSTFARCLGEYINLLIDNSYINLEINKTLCKRKVLSFIYVLNL